MGTCGFCGFLRHIGLSKIRRSGTIVVLHVFSSTAKPLTPFKIATILRRELRLTIESTPRRNSIWFSGTFETSTSNFRFQHVTGRYGKCQKNEPVSFALGCKSDRQMFHNDSSITAVQITWTVWVFFFLFLLGKSRYFLRHTPWYVDVAYRLPFTSCSKTDPFVLRNARGNSENWQNVYTAPLNPSPCRISIFAGRQASFLYPALRASVAPIRVKRSRHRLPGEALRYYYFIYSYYTRWRTFFFSFRIRLLFSRRRRRDERSSGFPSSTTHAFTYLFFIVSRFHQTPSTASSPKGEISTAADDTLAYFSTTVVDVAVTRPFPQKPLAAGAHVRFFSFFFVFFFCVRASTRVPVIVWFYLLSYVWYYSFRLLSLLSWSTSRVSL